MVLRAPGTNCDRETEHAFRLAGAVPESVHINQWLESPGLADAFQILCLPGGFSYGDDIAAGRILANRISQRLSESLETFRAADKLILGICNGFQVLLQCGLLSPGAAATPSATLTWNDSGRFRDCWVGLQVHGEHSVFLRGMQRWVAPIAHAEGKFVFANEEVRDAMASSGMLVLRYVEHEAGDGNPNGAELDVAGGERCDRTRAGPDAAPRTVRAPYSAPAMDAARTRRGRLRLATLS